MTDKQIFYYKIFDDKERLNYMKSSLPHKELEDLLKEYEKNSIHYVIYFRLPSDNSCTGCLC